MAVPFAPPLPRPAPRLVPFRATTAPTRRCSRPVPALRPVPPVHLYRPTGDDPGPDLTAIGGVAGARPHGQPTAAVVRAARSRTAPGVYLRRRLVLATVVTLAVLGAIRLSPGFSGGGPLAASGEPGSARPAAARTYVVQAGDTVWSIAHRFVPKGDERPLVEAITEELRGASLVPGQAIPIP